jgi:hypothetical protein
MSGNHLHSPRAEVTPGSCRPELRVMLIHLRLVALVTSVTRRDVGHAYSLVAIAIYSLQAEPDSSKFAQGMMFGYLDAALTNDPARGWACENLITPAWWYGPERSPRGVARRWWP